MINNNDIFIKNSIKALKRKKMNTNMMVFPFLLTLARLNSRVLFIAFLFLIPLALSFFIVGGKENIQDILTFIFNITFIFGAVYVLFLMIGVAILNLKFYTLNDIEVNRINYLINNIHLLNNESLNKYRIIIESSNYEVLKDDLFIQKLHDALLEFKTRNDNSKNKQELHNFLMKYKSDNIYIQNKIKKKIEKNEKIDEDKLSFKFNKLTNHWNDIKIFLNNKAFVELMGIILKRGTIENEYLLKPKFNKFIDRISDKRLSLFKAVLYLNKDKEIFQEILNKHKININIDYKLELTYLKDNLFLLKSYSDYYLDNEDLDSLNSDMEKINLFLCKDFSSLNVDYNKLLEVSVYLEEMELFYESMLDKYKDEKLFLKIKTKEEIESISWDLFL